MSEPDDELTPQPGSTATIDVRRNLWLTAAVGLVAAVLAVLFGWRAVADGAVGDWFGCGALTVIAASFLATLLDARAPLMVVDDQGVRVRRGAEWTGIAWSDVECLEHLPRRGARDGHLLVVGPDLDQLVVPLTLATRIAGTTTASVSDDLAVLARGRADVVEVVPGLSEDEYDDPPAGPDEDTVDVTEVRRALPAMSVLSGDGGPQSPTASVGATVGSGARGAGRLISNLLHRTARPATLGANALDLEHHDDVDEEPAEAPEAVEVAEFDDEDTAVRVFDTARPAAAEQTMTVVLPELEVQHAADPVIGPQLRSARERLRLSIDQLADRTRIRPHVLEAMEGDDFSACGGDFYARGHLRTLARVLGVESAPLVASYDAEYADAPVDPKRIFASELATGAGGVIRGTRGGRNWSVLVAAVMAAVLIWSVAQLVLDGPVPVGDAPVLNQSGGIANGNANAADAVPVTLTAVGGGAKLVVRDGGGNIVFDGRLAFGQSTQLDVSPPVRISSSDGSVTASIDGREASELGETGVDVTKTLVP